MIMHTKIYFKMNVALRFHDDVANCTFGIMKKKNYFSASDFRFEFLCEAINTSVPSSSGYLVSLTPTSSTAYNEEMTRY